MQLVKISQLRFWFKRGFYATVNDTTRYLLILREPSEMINDVVDAKMNFSEQFQIFWRLLIAVFKQFILADNICGTVKKCVKVA